MRTKTCILQYTSINNFTLDDYLNLYTFTPDDGHGYIVMVATGKEELGTLSEKAKKVMLKANAKGITFLRITPDL